jgi:hypothetical protein
MATKKKSTKSDKKPVLKLKKQVFFEVDYNDLDQFISDFYGVYYEFVADQECSNDSQHTFNIKKEKLAEYDQNKLNEFVNGKSRTYIARILLADLCNKDIIEPGKYLIKVCW